MPDELLQIVDPETGEPTGEHLPRREVFDSHERCSQIGIGASF